MDLCILFTTFSYIWYIWYIHMYNCMWATDDCSKWWYFVVIASSEARLQTRVNRAIINTCQNSRNNSGIAVNGEKCTATCAYDTNRNKSVISVTRELHKPQIAGRRAWAQHIAEWTWWFKLNRFSESH